MELENKENLKVGLLGGSFNPAHEGHLYISKKALELLGLDEIWWLVSPQNPLKTKEETAPFDKRFLSCEKIVGNNKNIIITDIERKINTQYSTDTIKALKNRFNKTKFVWIIGADNLLQFPKWKNWEEIFNSIPIAVFNRFFYPESPLESEASKRFFDCLLEEKNWDKITEKRPPVWAFLDVRKHPASSTEIRRKGFDFNKLTLKGS